MSIYNKGKQIAARYRTLKQIDGTYLSKEVVRSYRKGKQVFPDPIETFVYHVGSAGNNIPAIREAYSELPEFIRSYRKSTILMPVASGNKLLAMDNDTGQVVDDNFRFSRQSIATRFNGNSDMEQVGENIPRLDYLNYGKKLKILIEKQSTNLLLHSATFTDWKYNNATLEETENTCKGFANYYLCRVTGGTNSQGITSSPDYKTSSGESTVTLSAYLKKGNVDLNGFGLHALDSDNPVWNNEEDSFQEIAEGDATVVRNRNYMNIRMNGDEDVKLRITRKNIISPARLRLCLYVATPSTGVAQVGDTCLIAMPQMEIGNDMTSYIPTGADRATRAADLLTCDLPSDCSVYLRTTKKTTVLDKTAGLWNIHEDVENEGIYSLVLFDRMLTNQEKEMISI